MLKIRKAYVGLLSILLLPVAAVYIVLRCMSRGLALLTAFMIERLGPKTRQGEKLANPIVVRKNAGWKQECDKSKQNNQNFVQIPHARFIDILAYKARARGIAFITVEESYTSKCSFIDSEDINMKINIRKEMDKQLKKEQKAFDKRIKKLNEHSFSFSLFKWRF